MLRSASRLLASCSPVCFLSATRQIADAALEFHNPSILKKFVGLDGALGIESQPKEKLSSLLTQLVAAVKVFPDTAGYRQAIEATCSYRQKVLSENDSPQAVEEVLDAHMEELILEAEEELRLVPMMAGSSADLLQEECLRRRC
jgi:ETC complex I subunit conserved region